MPTATIDLNEDLTLTLQCMDEAERAERLAREATARLAQRMNKALAVLMPVGTVIDLRSHGPNVPLWLRGRTRLIRGADRGSMVFKTRSLPAVEPSLHSLIDSKWTVDVDPISEKTGKPMSGRTHGADGNRGARLAGSFSAETRYDLSGEAFEAMCRESVLAVFAAAQAAQAAQASQPTEMPAISVVDAAPHPDAANEDHPRARMRG